MTQILQGGHEAVDQWHKQDDGLHRIVKRFNSSNLMYYDYYYLPGTTFFSSTNRTYGDYFHNSIDEEIPLNCEYNRLENGVTVHFDKANVARRFSDQPFFIEVGSDAAVAEYVNIPLGDKTLWGTMHYTQNNTDSSFYMQIVKDDNGQAGVVLTQKLTSGKRLGSWIYTEVTSVYYETYELIFSIKSY